jgi:anti-anti-sigma factor
MMHDVNQSGAVNPDNVTTAGAGAKIVTEERLPGAVVLTVTGEVDMVSAPALENAVRRSLTERPARLVIDLTGAEFFSSAGIAVLVLAHRSRADVALHIVATDRIVLRPLELTGLRNEFAIYDSRAAALMP